MVCLLNFLIAIISDAYANVAANQINNIYQYRSILNLEYIQINGDKEMQDKFSFIIMVCKVQPGDKSNTDQAIQSISAVTRELFSATQTQL